MRGLPKPLLACMLAALLTLGIAACGDDSSGDSTGTTAQETPGSTAPERDDPGEASAEFRTPGGDNSIQDFGEEADASELEAATAALSGFLEARAEADSAGQCRYMAEAAVKPLEQLSARSQLKGKDCAAILEALSGGPASSRANTLVDSIASLRFEGDRGFALYHGPKGVDYFVLMFKEDGEWKVGSLAPTELP